MKCPKCHYLSFDPEPRCRNCGFSLGLDRDLPMAIAPEATAPPADLELRLPLEPVAGTEPEVPVDDRPVIQVGEHERRPRPVRRIGAIPRPVTTPATRDVAAAEELASGSTGVAPPTSELPLFVKNVKDLAEPREPAVAAPSEVVRSVPVVSRAAVVPDPGILPASAAAPSVADLTPAPPASRAVPATSVLVSKAVQEPSPGADPEPGTPIVADRAPMWRATSTPRTLGPLDHDLLKDLESLTKRESERAAAVLEADERKTEIAGRGRRIAAAVVDGFVLAAVIGGLLAVTLRWTSLTLDRVLVLPMWPLAVFLVLVAYGYLLLFTVATGQTPGKMVAGIRVVDAGATGDRADPLRAGQACLRELVALPAVLVGGLGFLPALIGEARGLHDRVAATRVVRA